MKLLGRIAGMFCMAALAGCGVEDSATENVAELGSQTSAIICPQLSPPGPGFCEDGTIKAVYDGKCIVGYECIRTAAAIVAPSCPILVPPADNFCPNGTIKPVYDSNKCIVSFRCVQ
ncbi:hypothetical protein [Archangium lipolyticum]|uniref:hypothetical protein n=1 Tax=Archangium lipolyticum TaxID=2970465 RepID=UPI00214A7C30|nr:hypothetical protein [Archangium lipolyticum]